MFGVLASQKIIYIKPLKIWRKFNITLKLEGSDEKWVYHRQIFEQNGQICAIGFTKAGFWKNKKAQNMRKILINSDAENDIKTPPAEILNLFNNDYEILKSQQ
jgi:acyl-CoA thioesterase FadM